MSMLETFRSWFPKPVEESVRGGESISSTEAASWLLENVEGLSEAFTQADIELALDDRGWLVGGKRMAGELDPLSRQVQINRSRYYAMRDPLVKQAIRLWTDYCFGAESMSYKAVMPDTSDPDKDTQIKLDKFMKDRRNRRYTSRTGQRRLSNRLLIDGDLFVAFFEDGTMRAFDPLQITDIISDPDDEDIAVAYKRVVTGKNGQVAKTLYYKPWDFDGDAIPPGSTGETQPYYGNETKATGDMVWEKECVMYHLAFDPFERRGCTLISAASDWTREHRRFMTARVAIAQGLARFAWKGKVKGGQKMVDSIRAKMESTFAQTGLSGGTEHQPANAPGGMWLENDGVSLDAMKQGTGASDAKTDSDNLKLQVCAGTGIMLHYFGDPSTGNLATATAMELPMLKMFGAYQQQWKDAWRDFFSIILEEGPEDEQKQVNVDLPDIIEEDLGPLGTFLASLTNVFPEAKTPSVLKRCLISMGVEDIDAVMEEIEDQREVIDAQNQQNREDMLAGKQVGLDPVSGKPVINPAAQNPGKGAGPIGQSPDATESKLLEAIKLLTEALKS